MTLFIATAVLPVVGTMNKLDNMYRNSSLFSENTEVNNKNQCFVHDIEIEWERFYGGSNDEVLRCVKQTNDDGYIGVGVKDSISHWLLKVNADGDEEWNVTALPNASLWPRCYCVQQTSDGGYITAGSEETADFLGYDRCIWKVDENGNTEWLKIYDDPLYGYHKSIIQTNDGGYIVSGNIQPNASNPTNNDALIMKTDKNGNIEWEKVWSYGEYVDNAQAIRQTADGGYIITGQIGYGPNDGDFLIIKTDANGNKEWEKIYGGTSWEQSQSRDILFTNDGGYMFLAETRSYGAGNLDLWLIKTDGNGNMQWNKTYGGKQLDMCGGMDFTDDGGIIITGTINSTAMMKPMSEGLVIKTDENGNIEWQKLFGYEKNDQLQCVYSTSDGNYIVSGQITSTATTGAGLMDGWFIKIKAFTNGQPSKPIISGSHKGKPNTNYTFTVSSTDPDGDNLLYMWDWGDGNYSKWLTTPSATYSWTTEDKFEIKVIVKDQHSYESEWSDSFKFSTTRNRAITINSLMLKILEHFPILQRILNLQ